MSCYHYKKHIAIIFKEANVKERVIRIYICDFGACKHFNHFAISHSDWAWISSSKKKSSCNHRYIFSFLSPSADILKGEQRWQVQVLYCSSVFWHIKREKKLTSSNDNDALFAYKRSRKLSSLFCYLEVMITLTTICMNHPFFFRWSNLYAVLHQWTVLSSRTSFVICLYTKN